jgi:peptidoglycan-N-acetylglucosamine deacetylase
VPLVRRRTLAAGLAVLLLLGACGESTPSPTGSEPSTSAVPTATGSSAPSTPQASDAEPTPTGSPAVTTVVVRAGDTLSSIGRAWGITVAQLQAWNAERYPSLVSDPDTLEAGWVLVVSGDPDATPIPTTAPTAAPPTPSPVATGCRAGNRVAAGDVQAFYSIPNAGHAVGLTLDMGGRLDPGVDILNYLIASNVCVTIFPTGAMAQTAQGQQIMAIVKAHPELFEVGNHTMHHCDLVRGGGGSPTTAPCAGITPTADFIRSELTDAAAIIQQYSGQNPQPYWRAPYGSISDAVRAAAASVGYTKTFGWDIDTIDWKPISDGGPTAQQIATKVITNAQDGSVVLMHLGGYETLDALKLMVPGLRDRGFLLTSLSDLLN